MEKLTPGARAVFGGAMGLVAGTSSALGFSQRLAFKVRPRQARRRAIGAFLVGTLLSAALGAGLAALDSTRYGTLFEGFVLGLLSALVALTIFLLPGIGAGLRLGEATKSSWSVVGAGILAIATRFQASGFTGDLGTWAKGLIAFEQTKWLDFAAVLERNIHEVDLQVKSLQNQIDTMTLLFLGSMVGIFLLLYVFEMGVRRYYRRRRKL